MEEEGEESVADTNEVGAQFLYSVRGGAGLYGLWVVCDKEGLLSLDDDDAFSTLPGEISDQRPGLDSLDMVVEGKGRACFTCLP